MDEPRMQSEWSQDADLDVEARRNVIAHRERVVRRLLLAGLSPRLLRRLLPDWGSLIDRIAAVVNESRTAQAPI